MADEIITEYITQARASGSTDAAITSALTTSGWSADSISEAMASQDSVRWDPVNPQGLAVNALAQEEQIESARSTVRFSYYQAHPESLRLHLVAILLLPVVIISFLMREFVPQLLLISLLGAVFYYSYVQSIAQEMLLAQVAEQKKWSYSAPITTEKWRQLSVVYPEVFDEVGHDQYVNNQFWGSTPAQFWMANFSYTQGSGKNSHTYQKSVYAVPLPQTVASDFILTPHAWFGGKELQTESSEFNKSFDIQFQGQKSSEGAKIFEILNPLMIEKILALKQACGSFRLLFRGTAMIICFNGSLQAKYTNLFITPQLDPRDILEIEGSVQQVVQLATDLLPYLS